MGVNLEAFRKVRLRCEGGESNVSSCAITTIASGGLALAQQARVRCFDQDGKEDSVA